MAVVRNHFEKELTDTSVSSITITGLTAENSTCSSNYVNLESSLYLLKSIYKTLIDAGYTDVIKNEDEYSISVLGFKFFIHNCNGSSHVISSSSTNNTNIVAYVYGMASAINYINGANSNYTTIITSDITKISFDIIVRGNSNCVYICYTPAIYPLKEYPIIFIAKAKNLITSENAYFCCSRATNNSSSYYGLFGYIRNKNDMYTCFQIPFNSNSDHGGLQTINSQIGLTTPSKFICEPITCYYGSFLIYSVLKCNTINFTQMKYYKIGSDIYYCYGFHTNNNTNYTPVGSPFLFKVN